MNLIKEAKTAEKAENISNQVLEGYEEKILGTMLNLWKKILKIDEISLKDDFFMLGGDSFKATLLAAKIHKEMGIEIPMGEIFLNPTLTKLVDYIKQGKSEVNSLVETVQESQYYPVSKGQRGTLILEQQYGYVNNAYNMPGIFVLEGKIDKKRFEKAFEKLIIRHETFRTSFKLINGEFYQEIHKSAELNIELLEATEREADEIFKEFVKPFDLSKPGLFKVCIVKTASDKGYLMIDMHHLISDGASMGIFANELIKLYDDEELTRNKLQYKDYVNWHNKITESADIRSKEDYWLSVFTKEPPMLNIQYDYTRSPVKSFEGDRFSHFFGETLSRNIIKQCYETGTTLFMYLFAAYYVLMSKYSGQSDIVVGTAISGRNHGGLENIIGVVVNTIAIRNYPEGSKTFAEFLEEVKQSVLRAMENQEYSIMDLVSKLAIDRDLSRNPLFDTVFQLHNMDISDVKGNDLTIKDFCYKGQGAKFDLLFETIEKNGKISVNIEYCTKLFKKETIEQMAKYYTKILEELVKNPEVKLSEVEMLSDEELKIIIEEFNDTEFEYSDHKTIQEKFEEQVAKKPDNIAVVFGDEKLTYRELSYKANSLANKLRHHGVKAESIVGLIVGRSLEMIIGILGILKAGGAYLPLDPEYPADRINYMLEDSQTTLLLVDDNSIPKIEYSGDRINLSDKGLYSDEHYKPEKINTQENLAYIIYTSGSTGKPKGTMIEHKSLINLIEFTERTLKIRENDRIVQFASSSFDASVWEIFMALLTGAQLHVISKEIVNDFHCFEDYLNNNGITLTLLPPVYLANLDSRKVNSLRILITGGSATNLKLLNNWKDKVEYVNAYGPTEATVCVSVWKSSGNSIPVDTSVPIGKPISNTQLYILDKDSSICPIGVPGELCISGAGISRGYLGKTELNAEKFVQHPYIKGALMYRTGDLARWLPDGNLEFLGRTDHQVKIRGFRIEPEEIENVLKKHEAIREIAIIPRKDNFGDSYLCAYYTTKESTKIPSENELCNFLELKLPAFMVPAHFVHLKAFPITANGKLDRDKLPEPCDANMAIGADFVPPQTDVEKRIANIWREITGREKIGIYDNFFRIGGNSMMVVKVSSMLKEKADIDIPVVELFRHTTIDSIVKYLDEKQRSDSKPVKQQGEAKDSKALNRMKQKISIMRKIKLEG